MALETRGTRLSVCLVGLVLLEFCPRVVLLRVLGLPEKDVIDVYNAYREAATDESRRSGSRRVLKNNTEYQIHVKRLKGVNGFKAHNLIIRSGGQPNVNKTMYINNPVESSMPQSFLTLDEFKQALMNRVQRHRDTFKRDKLKSAIIKMWKVKRKLRKQISTRKARFLHISTTVDSNKSMVNSISIKSTRKHRQLKLNRLTEDFNVSKPLKLNDNFTKEQNKTTPTLLQDEVTKHSASIVTNNSSTLVSVNENPILPSNKNFGDELITETKITVKTTTFTELQSTKHKEAVAEQITVNETSLPNEEIVKATETDVTETATSKEVTIGEPTTAAVLETELTTTESTRATLGRPAVYMGY